MWLRVLSPEFACVITARALWQQVGFCSSERDPKETCKQSGKEHLCPVAYLTLLGDLFWNGMKKHTVWSINPKVTDNQWILLPELCWMNPMPSLQTPCEGAFKFSWTLSCSCCLLWGVSDFYQPTHDQILSFHKSFPFASNNLYFASKRKTGQNIILTL